LSVLCWPRHALIWQAWEQKRKPDQAARATRTFAYTGTDLTSARMVKILERAEIMGDVLTRRTAALESTHQM
jgi:hypothetical protein